MNMFSHQLHSIVQRDDRTRNRFLGVYAADELPKRMPPQSLAIVNCCNRYYRGEHWLALYQDEWEDRLEIFDSYGLNPDIYNIVLPQAAVVTYSGKQLQSINSNLCGQYCLYFCYYRARGYTMGHIVSVFSNDFNNNDDYIYGAVLRLFKL